MLALGVQQSESVLHIYTYMHSFRFFSHIDCYRILSTVPCAKHSRPLLVVHLIHSSMYMSIQVFQFIPIPLLPGNHKSAYIYNCYCFADKYICTLLDSRYVISCDTAS